VTILYLIKVEHKIQLTDIVEELVQHLETITQTHIHTSLVKGLKFAILCDKAVHNGGGECASY